MGVPMKDQAGESCSICAWVDHQSKQTTDAPLEQCLSTPSLRMQCAITSHTGQECIYWPAWQ